MEFQLDRTVEILERTPVALRGLLSGLPEAWTSPNEGPDTFSAFDNVGHLIHGERNRLGSTRAHHPRSGAKSALRAV